MCKGRGVCASTVRQGEVPSGQPWFSHSSLASRIRGVRGEKGGSAGRRFHEWAEEKRSRRREEEEGEKKKKEEGGEVLY